MSYIGLDDTADGIHVTFYDTPDPDGDFAQYDLGTLPRNVPHTIKFWMKLNPGPDNDLVRIFIDGQDVGQCFTTWENFYRADCRQCRSAIACCSSPATGTAIARPFSVVATCLTT